MISTIIGFPGLCIRPEISLAFKYCYNLVNVFDGIPAETLQLLVIYR